MGTNASHVTLVGRLGNPPKTNVVNGAKGEKIVCGISVAMDDDQRIGDGNWKENTQWYWVEGWNGLAERMQSLKTGDEILVVGKLKQSTIVIGDQKVTRTKIWEDPIRLLRSAKPKPITPEEHQPDDEASFPDEASDRPPF